MYLTEIQDKLIGDWKGNNLLRTSWLTPPEHLSSSNLSVAQVANGKFLTFTYTWSHEDIAHEGLLVLAYNNEQNVATAAWVDSWHMSSKIMPYRGTIDQLGVIDLLGSYEAPPGPDWGWRIIIAPASGNDLQITMFNISPEGVEDLAVKADYKPAHASGITI
ncbi:MAG: DUF1579 domain-containing protein [Acidobacteria bacterium]|nr:DUF1579 domain-containing protein [Acidobacteriota bacterium]